MTTNPQPLVIEDGNLSRAWSRAVLHIIDNPGTAIAPLLVSISGFALDGTPQEDRRVRAALDQSLTQEGQYDVGTVAWTIFPQRYWEIVKYDRQRLYEVYMKTFPRIQALKPQLNRRGLYFERLIAYGGGPCDGNQLEWMIREFHKHPHGRRTKLQASVFDPCRDHVPDAQLVFPCLQHVTFVPDGGSLSINAFYATQQLFAKAYGNWLGLCHLGRFMAREMGLTLTQLNCFVGIEKLEGITKSALHLQPVVQAARACVAPPPTSPLPSVGAPR